jgi:uncharacterized protein with HEPN domain
MSRDYSLFLLDIIEACDKVDSYIAGLTYDEFLQHPMVIDAVVRNLEIIGEAVKSVPQSWIEIQPQINWKKVARFRDVIAHYYFKVDFEVVWTITQGSLGELRQAANYILEAEDKPAVD